MIQALSFGDGGRGIALAVDHLNQHEVRGLAERIEREHGTIDLLVNNIWGAEVLKGEPREWNTPIWRHDLDKGLRILRLAIDTHLITSHFLLPLLIKKAGGLLVEVTDGTQAYNAENYRISVYYDLAKVSINRFTDTDGTRPDVWKYMADEAAGLPVELAKYR